MQPLDFPILTDENIHPDVTAFLQNLGKDIETVSQIGLGGHSDLDIIQAATHAGRIILTHDSDFGTLAVMQQEPIIGIIYLRPGHILAQFTIDTLKTITNQALEVHPPFILVAERRGTRVKIRVRRI